MIEDFSWKNGGRAHIPFHCQRYKRIIDAYIRTHDVFDVWFASNKKIGLKSQNQKLAGKYIYAMYYIYVYLLKSQCTHVPNDWFPRENPKYPFVLNVYVYICIAMLSCGTAFMLHFYFYFASFGRMIT